MMNAMMRIKKGCRERINGELEIYHETYNNWNTWTSR